MAARIKGGDVLKVGAVTRIIVFIGIFLIIGGIVLEDSLIKMVDEINGMYSVNKTVISPKHLSGVKSKGNFIYDDVFRLSKAFGNCPFTFTSSLKEKTPDLKQDADIQLMGTNYMYTDFNDMTLICGRFFDKAEDVSNTKVTL
jgi:hypothetical protein